MTFEYFLSGLAAGFCAIFATAIASVMHDDRRVCDQDDESFSAFTYVIVGLTWVLLMWITISLPYHTLFSAITFPMAIEFLLFFFEIVVAMRSNSELSWRNDEPIYRFGIFAILAIPIQVAMWHQIAAYADYKRLSATGFIKIGLWAVVPLVVFMLIGLIRVKIVSDYIADVQESEEW